MSTYNKDIIIIIINVSPRNLVLKSEKCTHKFIIEMVRINCPYCT